MHRRQHHRASFYLQTPQNERWACAVCCCWCNFIQIEVNWKFIVRLKYVHINLFHRVCGYKYTNTLQTGGWLASKIMQKIGKLLVCTCTAKHSVALPHTILLRRTAAAVADYNGIPVSGWSRDYVPMVDRRQRTKGLRLTHDTFHIPSTGNRNYYQNETKRNDISIVSVWKLRTSHEII